MRNWLSFAIAFLTLACANSDSVNSDLLSPVEFSKALNANPEIVLLDVRTAEEMNNGFIPRAQNLDFKSADFRSALDKLDHSKIYFVYCASGARSGKTQEMMKAMGFTHVTAMSGGLNAWSAEGLATTKP